MAGIAKLFDGHILDKSNEEVNLNDEKYKGKVFGLYFSAHWCPPCRRFTPILIQFYEAHAKDKQFEIIFISSDKDEKSFNEYYKDMPWLTLDFKERNKKEDLTDDFHVRGIPSLILLDGESGDIICIDARDQIQGKDTAGKDFPWRSAKEKHSDDCIVM